ncbi:hypothetical protein [Halobacillus litoralis]|uniref:hypothetical protein n=1 Tax=Halobacillus litoralis TaxID=45668 RepID=UPI0024923730|nr:hypothetical protein [Halobacillus litoralis]
MTHVQTLIYQDARRQLIAGSVLSVIALVFIIGVITVTISSLLISLFYAAIFTTSGLSLLRTGYLDLKKSRQTDTDFMKDEVSLIIEKVPARMYVGHKPKKSYQAGLFDMDGELYGEIQEIAGVKNKLLRGIQFVNFFENVRSADFILKDRNNHALYQIEKKGGFSWRGYVQNQEGFYVAYTKDTKNKTTGQRITRYIEADQCRWSCEGDGYIGHFSIKDQDGRVWAVIKRGAIPREAAERFEQMPGYLVEWEIREHIPASLLAFIFLLQSRDQ